MKRAFVVGCPRSGTTLLQSFLATHPQIHSFPESHFLRHLLEKQTNLEKRIGLAPKGIKAELSRFLVDAGYPGMVQYVSKRAVFAPQQMKSFIRILDAIAEQECKIARVEKTPDHLTYIDYIEKHVETPCFIHILRKGTDVVASLYEVAEKYPHVWHGPWSIDYCIQKWDKALKQSLRYVEKSNHLIISYEYMVHNPEKTLKNIFAFLGMKLDYKKLSSRKETCQSIGADAEPWKATVGGAIQKASSTKFKKVFDLSQQAYIIEQLKTFGSLSIYDSIS